MSAEGSPWASTAQTVTVTGTGFESAMAVSVTGPVGSQTQRTFAYPALSLQATSFALSAVLSGKGTFTITVAPSGGAAVVSRSFSVAERHLACANPIELQPQLDPAFFGGASVIAMLVDRTDTSATVARLASQYRFSPSSIWPSLGGFAAPAPDALVDALRCDSAIKTIGYDSLVSVGR